MAISNWPKLERPREKLLHSGTHTLSDAELLAILLRTGVKGKTALDLAREILTTFGGLRKLLSTSKEQLLNIHGLGETKCCQLQVIIELAKRHASENLPIGTSLASPLMTERFIIAKLRDYPHEVFAGLFLDSKCRVLQFEELHHGTLSNACVYPREVIKRTLAHNAASVILAHNHPSGDAEPSQADIRVTHQLYQALACIEVKLLDHLIVGDNKAVSLAKRGYLKK